MSIESLETFWPHLLQFVNSFAIQAHFATQFMEEKSRSAILDYWQDLTLFVSKKCLFLPQMSDPSSHLYVYSANQWPQLPDCFKVKLLLQFSANTDDDYYYFSEMTFESNHSLHLSFHQFSFKTSCIAFPLPCYALCSREEFERYSQNSLKKVVLLFCHTIIDLQDALGLNIKSIRRVGSYLTNHRLCCEIPSR